MIFRPPTEDEDGAAVSSTRISKQSVIPECFYRESRIGNLDARLKYSGVTHQAN